MGRTLLRALVTSGARRSSSWETLNFGGLQYLLGLHAQRPSLGFKEEPIHDTFTDYAQYAYLNNAVVFALMERRRQVFSQARFRFQDFRNGTPGRFHGGSSPSPLDILDGPGRTDSSSDLMSQAIQHADLSGNAFLIRRAADIVCLRPDWVTIVAGSRGYPDQGGVAVDAEVLGLAYFPGGKQSGTDPVLLLPGEYAHFKPTPDPTARFRGISWLKPVVKEIMADSATTTHKLMFFENGATPSTVVSLDPNVTPERFKAWVDLFEEQKTGVLNAYKTIYLGGGADVEVVGSDLKQLDFKVTQGAGETRLAAAAGVPPIIAGFSEGLAAATYSNYGQARRAYSDVTLWDLWGKMSNALESIIPPPKGSRMWVDSSGIPFLQEDEQDAADILVAKANAMRTLWDGGAEPESVVKAVNAGDLSLLKHTGNLSVQLQPDGIAPPKDEPAPEPPASDKAQAIENARRSLVEAGIPRPTNEQVAEHMGIAVRTLYDWKREAA